MTHALALTKVQGLILAVGGAVFVAVALGSILLRGRRRVPEPDIPRAMRPGPSDADLETPLLAKLQGWGVLLVVFFVVWVPLVWLQEPSQNLAQEEALKTDSIQRGKHGVQNFSEENQGGVGCVRCHGPELRGSQIQFGENVIDTPDLTTMCGGSAYGHALIESLEDVYTAIYQGRCPPGACAMPSWSVQYSGALDDQQIADIVNYLLSIQEVPFGENVCINPEAASPAPVPAPSPSPSP